MGTFRMPSLGADMEAGTLVEWLKQPGDALHPGDIIAVVETQKGAIEVEVFEAGTLSEYLIRPGTTVPVGTPMAVIQGAGEPSTPPAPAAAPTPPPAAPSPPPRPAPPPARPPGTVAASPAARKLAADHALDLSRISGSGPGGAVLYTDVEAALRQTAQAPEAPKPTPTVRPVLDTRAMRTAIGAATSRAKREIPHYYLAHTTDITPTLSWLTQTNADRPPAQRLLPAAVYIKALARALRDLPEFNGFYREGGFLPSEQIHVGVAIALRGGGLVAPAIQRTDELSVDDIMDRLRDLVRRVRAGRFRSSELSQPTITLTSLGDRGVDLVMPIIYPPQVAILGLGTPHERPWVVDGKVEPRTVIDMSMAGDHRVSDGHRGALLLAAWADHLQRPEDL